MPTRTSKTARIAAQLAATREVNYHLRQGMAMDRSLLSHTSRELSKAQSEIETVKSIASRFSIVDDPQDFDIGGTHDDLWRGRSVQIDAPGPMPSLSPSDPNMPTTTFRHESIVAVLERVDIDRFSRMIHVRLKCGKEESAYGLAQTAIESMTASELENFITRYVVRDLVRDIVAKVKRR